MTLCACGAVWSGIRPCHCSGCHETFTAIGPFDRHRRNGKCMDVTAVAEGNPVFMRNEKGHLSLWLPEELRGLSPAERVAVNGDGRAAAVRAWAEAQGLKVAVRGRIAKDVIDAYMEAHGES